MNIDLIIEAGKDGNAILMMLPKDFSKRVIDWGKENIPEEYLSGLPGKGRENSPHITLALGITDETPDKSMEILSKQGPFEVELSGIGVFRKADKGYDVIKIDVESPILSKLNKEFLSNVELQDPVNSYKPHITLAYVKPNSCDALLGNEDFKGPALVDSYVWSGGKDQGGKVVKLKGKEPLKESLDYGSSDRDKEYTLQEVESYLLDNKLSVRSMNAHDMARIIISLENR